MQCLQQTPDLFLQAVSVKKTFFRRIRLDLRYNNLQIYETKTLANYPKNKEKFVDVLKAVMTRRSIRKYKDKPVTDEQIKPSLRPP